MRLFVSVMGLGLIYGAAYVSAEQIATHGAHEHGRAKLMLVAEKQQLTLQFESPAMNIVGFEHEAKTKEQKTLIREAVNTLAKADALFDIVGGQCKFSKASVDSPFSEDAAHKDHDDKGREHEKHDHDKHKHDEHEHDKHDKHDEHADEAEHREYTVEYQATCQSIDNIEQIDFTLLKAFSGIEVLEVQYIHAGKQGAARLNANQTVLRF